MIRIPKDYFANLNAQRYGEYLKLLPDMKNEHTQAYTMLAFTLAALSFFGIFAINPTLSTIVNLKRQLSDSTFVHQQLTDKINSLSILQQKYTVMSNDLPYLYAAIPKEPASPTLLAQVQALAKQDDMQLSSLHTFEVALTPSTQRIPPGGFSYVFLLEAEGSYDKMLQFASDLSQMDRIVTIELFSISKNDKDNSLVLTLRGRQYFLPETASVPGL